MKKIHLIMIAAATTALIACDNSSKSAGAAHNGKLAASDVASDTLSPSGDTTMIARVEDMEVRGADTDSDILAQYPELGARVATLESVTEVRETSNGTFDFYAGDILTMTIAGHEDGSLTVEDSVNGFAADRITFTSPMVGQDQGQDLASASFAFELSSCRAIEEPKQEQVQSKEQSQEVGQSQDQSQNKVVVQGGVEGKEQIQGKEPKQECASVVVTLNVMEQRAEPKQEQSQDKEQAQSKEQSQDKEQAQSKTQSQDKGA